MGEVVNLRRARKRRDRAEADKLAERNRAEHGVPKAERRIADAERDRTFRTLDGARRERDT